MVSTQEEAESSGLCEDTSGAHPEYNGWCKERSTLFLPIKVAIDDNLKAFIKSWIYVSDFISLRSTSNSLKTIITDTP